MNLKLIILFNFIIYFTCTNRIIIPDGWRTPLNSEVNDSWRLQDKNKYLYAIGDFNNDGNTDEVKLLVKRDSTGFGLFFYNFRESENMDIRLLVEENKIELLHVMGVKKVVKGKYKTATGKGYWDSQTGEPDEIDILCDAIDYFKFEGANSYFVWDSEKSKFKRYWISD
jgi:hypothetical protein